MDEFLRKIANETAEILRKKMQNTTIRVVEVAKNNCSAPKCGICILKDTESETAIGPVQYVDDLVWNLGEDPEKLADYLISTYQETEISTDIFKYDYLKTVILPQLVSKKFNEELLKTVPYRAYTDLAVVLGAWIPFDGHKGRILIRNEMLEGWGKSFDELFEIATNNFWTIDKTKIMDSNDFEAVLDKAVLPYFYVITNTSCEFGAARILDFEAMNGLVKKHDSALIVIPSSIHEMIVVPKNELETVDIEGLTELIRNTNNATVDPAEWLSDHPYIYTKNGVFMTLETA